MTTPQDNRSQTQDKLVDELQGIEQSRAEFVDGAWYWVRKETGWGEETIDAPAMYKANCKAWFSYEFSGIPTRELEVLGPVARSAPAAPVELPEPVAYVAQGCGANIRWRAGMTYADIPAIDGQGLYTADTVRRLLERKP